MGFRPPSGGSGVFTTIIATIGTIASLVVGSIATNGSTSLSAAGVYGGLGYKTSAKFVQKFTNDGLGEHVAAEFLNASSTSGIGAYTFHGDCGVLQFFSVSSGQALLTYVPNDVNLNSQDCIDQGINTLHHGVTLGNGQVGYQEPILPNAATDVLDLGIPEQRWRDINGKNLKSSTLVVDGTDVTSTPLGVFGTVLQQENTMVGSIGLLLTNAGFDGGMMFNTDDCGAVDMLQGNNAFSYFQFLPSGVSTSTLNDCGREIPTDNYYGVAFGNTGGGTNNFYPLNPSKSSLGFVGNPWLSMVASSTVTTNLNVATSSAATATYYMCADSAGNVYKKTTACN